MCEFKNCIIGLVLRESFGNGRNSSMFVCWREWFTFDRIRKNGDLGVGVVFF